MNPGAGENAEFRPYVNISSIFVSPQRKVQKWPRLFLPCAKEQCRNPAVWKYRIPMTTGENTQTTHNLINIETLTNAKDCVRKASCFTRCLHGHVHTTMCFTRCLHDHAHKTMCFTRRTIYCTGYTIYRTGYTIYRTGHTIHRIRYIVQVIRYIVYDISCGSYDISYGSYDT
jgi:hypothetical protein